MDSLNPNFIDALEEDFDSLIVSALISAIKVKCINEAVVLIEQGFEIDESDWFGSSEVGDVENSRELFIRELFLLSHNESVLIGTLASKFPDAALRYFYEKSFDEYENGFYRINSTVDLLQTLLGLLKGSEEDYFILLHLSSVITEVLNKKTKEIYGMYCFLGFDRFENVSIEIADVIIELSKRKVSSGLSEIIWDIYKLALSGFISVMFEDDN
ncbi:hypothetical protein MAQ5080_02578 [Marinomonas aquimarina]|uniref:Uncharacterized protein n=1 Tax=Marinomonas aquimarina TaxID=295068 RepID=A0A1A8TJ30_9GAMM|nr:hypothetical protein [Marinomonas aquimarina]SBS33427.1 hypothetical protein MAQ5080_02578 [Marinomonas aquimarina]